MRISNERADFIQDLTFSKVMYLLKGVIMFMILNIDVADKNPKYKSRERQSETDTVNVDSVTIYAALKIRQLCVI